MPPGRIDFVIITPLAEERDAVLAHLPGHRKLPPTADDIRVYYAADLAVRFPDGAVANYTVVVVPLAGMGHNEAASATGDAVRRWQPGYVLLIGIAGGVAKAGVKLGDVLISDQVADYELQKIIDGKPSTRWQVHRTDQRLLIAAQNFIGSTWKQTTAQRPNEEQPQVHFGPICTGNKVIANKTLMQQFRDVWVKLIGVEMEAGGVANAVSQSAQMPGFFMIRGVSDLADGRKDSHRVKIWRAYACEIAAAYAIEFLKSGPVPADVIEKRINVISDNFSCGQVYDNPFKTSGALGCHVRSYVERECDSEFRGLLDKNSNIYITGLFEVGKSSLMERTRLTLSSKWLFFGQGLAEMRSENETLFIGNFFKMFEDVFGKIEDWSRLAECIKKQPCVIFLDDLGEIEAPGLKALVPRLHGLIQNVGENIRVIATLPDPSVQISASRNANPLNQIFEKRGVQNPKYARSWKKIVVPPFEEINGLALVKILPDFIARIVQVNWQNVVSYTKLDWQGRANIAPRKLQCLCYHLFDAYQRGAEIRELELILNNEASYE